MRIMIIGYSGSGKSTLARVLSTYYNVPCLHLDTLQFSAHWEVRSSEVRDHDLKIFLDQNEHWVIDGNYSQSHFNARITLADQIYILNYNRITCLINAFKRYKTYKHQSRPCITPGCPEKLDREFIAWLIYKGRSKKRRQLHQHIMQQSKDKTIAFKNRRTLQRHLKTMNINEQNT